MKRLGVHEANLVFRSNGCLRLKVRKPHRLRCYTLIGNYGHTWEYTAGSIPWVWVQRVTGNVYAPIVEGDYHILLPTTRTPVVTDTTKIPKAIPDLEDLYENERQLFRGQTTFTARVTHTSLELNMARFIGECILVVEGEKTPLREVYNKYQEFCMSENTPYFVTKQRLNKKMLTVGGQRYKSGGVWYMKNITFR